MPVKKDRDKSRSRKSQPDTTDSKIKVKAHSAKNGDVKPPTSAFGHRSLSVSSISRRHRHDRSASASATNQRLPTVIPKMTGADVLRNARINKGLAFSLRERQQLGIHGLLPPSFIDQREQMNRVMENLQNEPDDLARYVALSQLQERNERLFYHVLEHNINELMPIVYTPTVGLACQKFGRIYQNPKGVYLSIYDSSVAQIVEVLRSWPESDVRAIVVTDGERILGLGDLGTQGMGIPVGKLALYVALAGVQPQWCLPVQLDVGTNNETLLDDPWYIGLRHKRVTGDQYDQFIDNFMQAVVIRVACFTDGTEYGFLGKGLLGLTFDQYGQHTLIQFEDFGNSNAFRLIEKYIGKYCTFNDDIQGTASVAVAGILAAAKHTKSSIKDHKILFYGAGEAAIGIATLCCMAIQNETHCSWDEATEHIWMVDSKGLIVKGRDNVSTHKAQFAQEHKQMKDLELIVKKIKPTALIGAATIAQAFTPKILQRMADYNERPIIFALSNPTSKAECTAQQAYENTDYRCVFASGSPFAAVTTPEGGVLTPGQGNNAYVFPAFGLAAALCRPRHLNDEHFLVAAQTLASLVSKEHFNAGRVYPPLQEIREISLHIALKLSNHFYQHEQASLYPEPKHKEQFLRAHLYRTEYENYERDFYDWPPHLLKHQ